MIFAGLGEKHYSTFPLFGRGGSGDEDVIDSICNDVGDDLEQVLIDSSGNACGTRGFGRIQLVDERTSLFVTFIFSVWTQYCLKSDPQTGPYIVLVFVCSSSWTLS